MGALHSFKLAWRDHREAVRDILKKYEADVAKLEKHEGSAYGKELREKLDADYNAKMAAARDKFAKASGDALQRMKANMEANEKKVEPPTAEQLAILQALQLTNSMKVADYQRYAEAMEGNQLALRALHDIAADKLPGGGSMPEYKGKGDRAWEQCKELDKMAKGLMRWDGSTSRGDALRASLDESRAMGHLHGTFGPAHKAFEAAAAGDIDGTLPDAEFYKKQLGLLYDEQALQLLDD